MTAPLILSLLGTLFGTLSLVLVFHIRERRLLKRMKAACVESAHGGYLSALEFVRKRLCPWCKLGVGVAKTRHAGPWKHGAAKNEGCRASWVIDYEWEYREAARKQGTPK